MTRSCLDLIGARGSVIAEGPFARNADCLAMLHALSPGGVETAASATGTSTGAALLFRQCLDIAAEPFAALAGTGPCSEYIEHWQKAGAGAP